MKVCFLFASGIVGLSLWSLPAARAGDPRLIEYTAPAAPSSEEPMAKELSAKQAGDYLDRVSVLWTRQRRCGTCHTNYPYLMARPVLGADSAGLAEVRRFFEQRAEHWDRGEKGDAPRWDTEVVATATALAINDARTGGKLHPLTRKALDRMWTLQKEDGSWSWIKCDWPPMEHDDYYGAVYAALGAGLAPEGYAASEAAKKGIARLKTYLRKTQAPDLHHRAMLLWASTAIPDLLSEKDQQATIKALLAIQREDGGWSLPSLGAWKRRDDSPNNPASPSDGYATGLVIYILRQAGVPAETPAIRKGVTWLKAHQRTSGRWYTRSLNTDRAHYITNAGTCFAVLALDACEALK